MTWDWTLKATDLAIVFATLLGPVLAVQAQRLVERGREKRDRRITIFRTLMATRASALSPQHVEAINAVPLDFYGFWPQHKAVVTKWKTYIDYLYRDQVEPNVWQEHRRELFTDLLGEMARAVGYKFTKVELERELYSPKFHGQLEEAQTIVRQGLVKLFKGEANLPLDIRSFPVDPAAVQRQLELWRAAKAWLEGETAVKVDTHADHLPQPKK